MELQLITYEDLLKGENKYDEDTVVKVYKKMLESVNSFVNELKSQLKQKPNSIFNSINLSDYIYLDEERALQAVFEALDDLKRLKDFHPVIEPNQIKYASYLAYWWNQRKPLTVFKIESLNDDEMLARFNNFNELFLVTFILCELFDRSVQICCSSTISDYQDEWDSIQNFLLYFFCYRAISPKSIEAFLLGAKLHPIWTIAGGSTSE